MSSPENSCGERTSTSLVLASSASPTSSRLARIASSPDWASKLAAAWGGTSGAGGRRGGALGGGGPALADPLLARAVEQPDVVVAVVLQVPVGVGGEPVVAIAVEHDLVIVGDPARAEQLAERLRSEEVALDLVLQLVLPVKADGAANVGLGVEPRV